LLMAGLERSEAMAPPESNARKVRKGGEKQK
jgi:hypothetical protein